VTANGRYRDFDAERAERVRDPLRFRLGGEDFVADGGIPATAVFDLAVMSEAEGDAAFLAFRDFLLSVLPGDDEGRLMATLRAARVPLEQLADVVSWLIAQATARPTPRRSASPESPRKNGRRSKHVSLSPVTPPADSTG
jgi:hypothetical protein